MPRPEGPLSPALKRYLEAFDDHLRARTPDDHVLTRARMVTALADTGIRPPGYRDRVPNGVGRRQNRCEDCRTPISAKAKRCHSCAAIDTGLGTYSRHAA